MAESYVRLPADGVGKKIRSIEKAVGANTVHMEGQVPYDEDGNGLWAVGGDGYDALLATIGLEGEHTNPRKFEADNGFYSEVVTRVGGVATPLWTLATMPVRTAGLNTTIYTLEVENSTGGAVTGWLEIGGAAITIPFHISNNDSVTIEYVAGLKSGDADVDCNASVNDVVFSIKGTEV